MSTNLYQLLGVSKDATSEQIRKAYRKQALKTHPDKLPPGLSEEEKSVSAERFKEISHACEILTDPERRKEYDTHGVWPPPKSASNEDFDPFWTSRGFSSPLFATHSRRYRSTPFFRDPFELFDSIFREFDDLFATQAAPSSSAFIPFSPFDPFEFSRPRGIPGFVDPFGSMPGLLSPLFSPTPMSSFARASGIEQNGGYETHTESYVTHTVNGVTQSTHTRRDRDGNAHVRRKLPNGREVYTINGVEQPARGYIQQASHESRQSSYTQFHHHSALPYLQPQRTYSRQRSLSPRNQTRRDIYSVPAEGYHDHSPPHPGSNPSGTYVRRTNRDVNVNTTRGDDAFLMFAQPLLTNDVGFPQYDERHYSWAPDHL